MEQAVFEVLCCGRGWNLEVGSHLLNPYSHIRTKELKPQSTYKTFTRSKSCNTVTARRLYLTYTVCDGNVCAVVGCPDIIVTPDTSFKRTASGAVIGCARGGDIWRLTCENTRWRGDYGNCSDGKINFWQQLRLRVLILRKNHEVSCSMHLCQNCLSNLH